MKSDETKGLSRLFSIPVFIPLARPTLLSAVMISVLAAGLPAQTILPGSKSRISLKLKIQR